jgi:hypothetical protein
MDISSFKKFINRVHKSSVSILLFYTETIADNSNRQLDNLLIKKKVELGSHPKFLPEIEIVFSESQATKSLTLNVEHLNNLGDDQFITFLEKNNSLELLEYVPQNLDLNNYYKIITETDFIRHFREIFFFGNDDYYCWRKKQFYGLYLDQKDFNKKQSDFGSLNTQTYLYANSLYLGFKKDKIFSLKFNPNDYSSTEIPAIEKLGKELFEYFYDGKEFILINFDDMELDRHSRIFFENRRQLINDKKFILPKEFQNNTFILSDQTTTFIHE